MNSDEFLVWARDRPGRWELHDGSPIAMSPERVIHGDYKYRTARAFDAAISAAKAPCRFVLDSAAVRIDERRTYQPDLMVYCGPAARPDAIEIANPVILVEILSPSNALTDLRDKLAAYFTLPSVAHYLIVDPDKRLILHHARATGGDIATRIVSTGAIRLDPPGLEIAVAEIFSAT
ncbi:MAG: Uma2 family endonuclease [Parvularculaceae bacterium]